MSYDSRNDGFSLAMGVIVVVAAIVVIIAITLGGWWAGWWFKTQNTNRESHLYQHEYGHQHALIEEIGSKQATLNEITVQLGYAKGDEDQTAALKTQRLGVANVICADAAQLNGNYDGLSQDQRTFVITNCDGATVAVDSPLRPRKDTHREDP